MELTVVIQFSDIWEKIHPISLNISIQKHKNFFKWNSVWFIFISGVICGVNLFSKTNLKSYLKRYKSNYHCGSSYTR